MSKWWEEVNEAGVPSVASSLGLKVKNNTVGPCPACGADHRGSKDRRYPIGMTPENKQGWFCHRCKASGSTIDLIAYQECGNKYKELTQENRRRVYQWSLDNRHTVQNNRETFKKVMRAVELPEEKQPQNPNSPFRWSKELPALYKSNLHSAQGRSALEYLQKRKLDLHTIEAADLGYMKTAQGEEWIAIPLKDKEGEIVNMRFRSVPPAKKQYRVCSGRPMPLYGSDTLDLSNGDQVIITEGELDVLALHTIGYDSNVVSGTAGASANWKEDWLDQLEPFSHFFVFYDNDKAGDEGAIKLAEKLGEYRCFRTKLRDYNDVGELLQDKNPDSDFPELAEAFDKAAPFGDTIELKRADDYLDQIEQLIETPEKLRGLPASLDRVTTCCGGISDGLWVITGDTGAGKTTWATFECWYQATQGVPVMLTSFEQRPIGTVQKLLRCQIGGDFTKATKDQRRQAMNQLGAMPCYILDHYGNASLDQIISSIRFARRRYGLKIALIDHLGFLINTDPNTDERREIEQAIRKLATISIQDKFTIFLICHPNNMSVAQQRRVKITDLKGASAVRQDAHIGVVVDRQQVTKDDPYPRTTLWFDKVRSEFGNNGSHCTLAFDPIACVYAESWEDTPAGKRGAKVIVPQ